MAVSNSDGEQARPVTAAQAILSRLRDEPGVFVWQQAVRILEGSLEFRDKKYFPPGFMHDPKIESPRLDASPNMNHAYADLEAYHSGGDEPDRLLLSLTDASRRYTLLGAHGIMPAWYSELALERLDAGDSTLVDFLAMFEHRLLSLAYRAWWHHRVELRREKHAARQSLPDVDRWFDSLAGLGTSGQIERLQHGIGWIIRGFAPLFASSVRPASGLASILTAYAGTSVCIREMVVRWCLLDVNDRSYLPIEGKAREGNCALGRDLVLGERIPEAQSNFHIILGPMSWKSFCLFLPAPGGRLLEGLCELARLYAGADRSFGVRLILDSGESRGICLGGSKEGEPYLGWNIWLTTSKSAGSTDDAFFVFGENAE